MATEIKIEKKQKPIRPLDFENARTDMRLAIKFLIDSLTLWDLKDIEKSIQERKVELETGFRVE